MPIRCIIIDDEEGNIINLAAILSAHCKQVEVVATAQSAQAGMDVIRQQSPDLVFLDIEMPHGTGFDLLEMLGEISFEVIFVTAYNQYAIKAIRFCALDYLLKPIHIPDLLGAVNRLEKKLLDRRKDERMRLFAEHLQNPEKTSRIALPMADEIRFAEIADIVRCEGDNNYTWFYFKQGARTLVSKTLREFEDLLSAYGFVRVHRSHLINTRCVQSYIKKDGGYLLMTDGAQIAISRNKKDEMLTLLMNNQKG